MALLRRPRALGMTATCALCFKLLYSSRPLPSYSSSYCYFFLLILLRLVLLRCLSLLSCRLPASIR